jgi:tripartite-type tricarboxylate transporter receptor subunit TctC
MTESGFPGFEQSSWHGIFAPAGTPQLIITKLNSEIVCVLKLPDVKARFALQVYDITPSSPEELADFLKLEAARYEKLIKEANICIQ